MKKIKQISIVLLTLSLFLIPNLAFAQNAEVDKQIQNIFTTVNVIVLFLQAFLWPILLMIGSLLSNDIIFSGGMQTTLLNIWTAVRDFVNVLFVLGLLFVAIYNILGLRDDKYSVKAMLPKIAIGLIYVNFSFLFCKVILDVVNVTTTAIFAVPIASSALKDYQDPTSTKYKNLETSICDKYMKGLSGGAKTSNTVGIQQDNPFCKAGPAPTPAPAEPGKTPLPTQAKMVLTEAGKTFFSTFNSRNVALVMAIELMDITNLDNVKADGVKSLKDLTINMLFSIVFFVIYASSFVALFISLVARVVVVWIAVAVSPLSALAMSFEAVKTKLGEDEPMKLFMDHALTPVFVAPILTIGMIMITQLKALNPNAISSTNPADFGALTTGISTIQDLIAGLATAAFIFTAAFKALESGKAKGVIGSIKKQVSDFGTSVAKLPLYAPILPVYTKDGKSTNVGLAALGPMLTNNPLNDYQQKEKEKYQKLFGSPQTQVTEALKSAKGKEATRVALGETVGVYSDSNKESMGKEVATKIKAEKLQADLKVPPDLKEKFPSVDKFLADLEAGKVTSEEYKKFMEANNIKGGMINTTGVKDTAKKAKEQAKEPELQGKVKKVTDAEEELSKAEKAGKADDVKTAKDKLEKATDELKEAVQAKEKVTSNVGLTASDVKEGKVNDEKTKQYKAALDEAAKVLGDTQAEALMTKALTAKGIANASDLVANIKNGKSIPPSPPVPANPTPGTPPTP